MTWRRVARIFILFKFHGVKKTHGMAYIQWYQTVGTADPLTGMYLLRRTLRFDVIDVARIERGVHLIPKFGNELGSTAKVREARDRDQGVLDAEYRYAKANGAKGAKKLKADEYDYFDEWWLNIWIDNHMYNTIF